MINNAELSYTAVRLSVDEERSSFLSQDGGLGSLLSEERRKSRKSTEASSSLLKLRDVVEADEEEEEQVVLSGSEADIQGKLTSTNSTETQKYLDPYYVGNRGIFASYFSVGFGLYFVLTPLVFYMVDTLDATPTQQSVISGLQYLPWALKMFCGFLSDSTPIFGKRRKPYFILGWSLFTVCNLILASFSEPPITILALFFFLMTMSFVLADVCTDAMIVERSKLFEEAENRGHLQASGYIVRMLGCVLGALLGAILYNKSSWGWGVPIWGIFIINGCVPFVIIAPFVYSLEEMDSEVPPSIRLQIQSIWELVQRKAVWQPCAFIYIYNVFFLQNPAWNSFLVDGLGFSNLEIGMLTLFAAVMMYLALTIYRHYLFHTSWRVVYIGATTTAFLFSCLQLVLVLGIDKKIGLSSPGGQLFLAMGSYGIVQFVNAIQFLPSCRMFLGMCPDGAEGASYAMLTTLSNLASTVAYSIAGAFAKLWNVNNDELTAHHYDGMWRLTLLCGCAQLAGLFFLGLLPSGVEEQLKLQQEDFSSKWGGAAFVTVVTASLIFVISFTILSVISS